MAWSRKFEIPIALKDGRTIESLSDARALMAGLPQSQQSRSFWQYTAELLHDAAELDGNIADAWAQLSRALTAQGLL